MKIITDIERMGDYTVDIAKTAKILAENPPYKPLIDIPKMADIVQRMLREVLEAFVSRDLELVEKMISDDDKVDHFAHYLHEQIADAIQEKPSITRQALRLLLITRYLERIADHITNVGERVYYMETGELKELHQ
jgi:phosphate transport system protein